MRNELIENINKNLESASDEVLEAINKTLTDCKEEDKEKSIERGLLFTRITDFITDCNDVSFTNKDTQELEALGVAMADGVDIIHPLLTDYIEIWLDGEMILGLHAQSPVLTALKELFEQISYQGNEETLLKSGNPDND